MLGAGDAAIMGGDQIADDQAVVGQGRKRRRLVPLHMFSRGASMVASLCVNHAAITGPGEQLTVTACCATSRHSVARSPAKVSPGPAAPTIDGAGAGATS